MRAARGRDGWGGEGGRRREGRGQEGKGQAPPDPPRRPRLAAAAGGRRVGARRAFVPRCRSRIGRVDVRPRQGDGRLIHVVLLAYAAGLLRDWRAGGARGTVGTVLLRAHKSHQGPLPCFIQVIRHPPFNLTFSMVAARARTTRLLPEQVERTPTRAEEWQERAMESKVML
jgi:hypothetical protein